MDRLKKTQGQENSSLAKISQNSRFWQKLKNELQILTKFKGKIHRNGYDMDKKPPSKLQSSKKSVFMEHWAFFKKYSIKKDFYTMTSKLMHSNC